MFQDSDFAGDLEDSKSTSGGTLCIFGSHTLVPISWMCQKQTSVSHSSTESEIVSLDTGLRLDGFPALELWDLIFSVLGNVSRVSDGSGKPESDVHKRQKSHNKIDVVKDIDLVPSNVQSANRAEQLNIDSRPVFFFFFLNLGPVAGQWLPELVPVQDVVSCWILQLQPKQHTTRSAFAAASSCGFYVVSYVRPICKHAFTIVCVFSPYSQPSILLLCAFRK